ncbi:hypothetical protein [Bdellovibrio sp. BCCA]|uniref:hypothetical protein n=1 Tax=Bdellovibrio sp. BCCA TaxID=3136281 RepID=UPI0030F322D0
MKKKVLIASLVCASLIVVAWGFNSLRKLPAFGGTVSEKVEKVYISVPKPEKESVEINDSRLSIDASSGAVVERWKSLLKSPTH